MGPWYSHVSEVLDLSDADARPHTIQFRLAGKPAKGFHGLASRVTRREMPPSLAWGIRFRVLLLEMLNRGSSPVSITTSE